MASFIHQHFLPLAIHIKENAQAFRRFQAIWTPSAIVLDSDGAERWRIEGYLPKPELHAQLVMALARISVMRKRWMEAEPRYTEVIESFAETSAVPEAMYWRAVARYRQTQDHGLLEAVGKELRDRHPTSIWAIKASVWA